MTRISKRGWRRLAALVRGREAEQLAETRRRVDSQLVVIWHDPEVQDLTARFAAFGPFDTREEAEEALVRVRRSFAAPTAESRIGSLFPVKPVGEDFLLRPRDVRRALEDREEIRRMMDED